VLAQVNRLSYSYITAQRRTANKGNKMTDNEMATIIESCWKYAKTSGHHPVSDAFERWFKNRARTLHQINVATVDRVWAAALKMHS